MNSRYVAFHYVLKNQTGETLDESTGDEPLSYVEGESQIIPGLEKQLASMNKGDKKKIHVKPEDAYGTYKPELEKKLPRDQFPTEETIEVGDQFRLSLPNEEPHIFTVTAITDTQIDMNGNHPLAGQDLFFDIEVMEMREATEADKEADEGCCDHDHDHDHEGHTHH